MMSWIFCLFTQLSDSGPHHPLVFIDFFDKYHFCVTGAVVRIVRGVGQIFPQIFTTTLIGGKNSM